MIRMILSALVGFMIGLIVMFSEELEPQFFTIDGIEYSTESTLLEFDGFVVIDDEVITFTD